MLWLENIFPLKYGIKTFYVAVYPGQPAPPKVVSSFKNCINLTWAPPEKDGGSKILGYQLEKRKKDTNQWVTLNPAKEPISGTCFPNIKKKKKPTCL